MRLEGRGRYFNTQAFGQTRYDWDRDQHLREE